MPIHSPDELKCLLIQDRICPKGFDDYILLTSVSTAHFQLNLKERSFNQSQTIHKRRSIRQAYAKAFTFQWLASVMSISSSLDISGGLSQHYIFCRLPSVIDSNHLTYDSSGASFYYPPIRCLWIFSKT